MAKGAGESGIAPVAGDTFAHQSCTWIEISLQVLNVNGTARLSRASSAG